MNWARPAVACAWWLRHSHAALTVTVVAVVAVCSVVAGASPVVLLGVPVAALAWPAWLLRQGVLTDTWTVLRHWTDACRDSGLDRPLIWPANTWRGYELRGRVHASPRIRHLHITPTAITVTAERMRITNDAWADAAPKLGDRLGYGPGRFRTAGRRSVIVTLPRVISDGIPQWTTTPASQPADLTGLPVARDTHGRTATVPLLGNHLMVLGATGAGKGSVIWSVVAAVAADVRSGRVQLWALDAKGGIELNLGRQVFTRFSEPGQDSARNAAAMIAAAKQAMIDRQAHMLDTRSRLHVPTVEQPLIVLIIDEFLALATIPDKTLRQRIMDDLTLILSQGRACGVTVAASAQLAQKDVLGSIRDLFPAVVGLRMTSPEQARMALGADAVRNGAKADTISDEHPGTGFLIEDGKTPTLVRFPWWSDAALARFPAARPQDAAPVPVQDAPPARLTPAAWVSAQPQRPTAGEVMDATGCSRATAFRALRAASHPPVSGENAASGDPTETLRRDGRDTPDRVAS